MQKMSHAIPSYLLWCNRVLVKLVQVIEDQPADPEVVERLADMKIVHAVIQEKETLPRQIWNPFVVGVDLWMVVGRNGRCVGEVEICEPGKDLVEERGLLPMLAMDRPVCLAVQLSVGALGVLVKAAIVDFGTVTLVIAALVFDLDGLGCVLRLQWLGSTARRTWASKWTHASGGHATLLAASVRRRWQGHLEGDQGKCSPMFRH